MSAQLSRWANGHVESFHGRLRDECLNVNWFWNLWDARRKISNWRFQYNSRRPHSALRTKRRKSLPVIGEGCFAFNGPGYHFAKEE
jgi:transposase InsO family protein